MKKSIYGILLVLVVLLCSACNGNVTRGIRHAGYSVGDKFTCSRFFPKDKDDVSYERIKYITGSHIINTEGKIYELSLGQLYANKENCKEAQTNIKVKAIFDNSIVKATDNKYYYLVGQNNTESYREVTPLDNSYYLYDLLLKGNDVVKVMTANSSNGSYYVLKTDGNVYENIVMTKDRNKPPEVVSSKTIYDVTEYGSNILDFNFVGNSGATYIKTEDKIYRMLMTNKDKCTKYADITCNYQMQEDTQLEEFRDRIIAFNGSTIITDYKQIFTLGG